MAEILKVALDRLRQQKAGVSHPEADLLTAFVEHSLPERERAQVLQHLAACAACREVVALAAAEAPAPVVAAERPRPLFGLVPKQAFVLATAVVACVVVVGVLSLPDLMRSRQAATTAAVSDSVPAAPARTPAASADQKVGSETDEQLAARQKRPESKGKLAAELGRAEKPTMLASSDESRANAAQAVKADRARPSQPIVAMAGAERAAGAGVAGGAVDGVRAGVTTGPAYSVQEPKKQPAAAPAEVAKESERLRRQDAAPAVVAETAAPESSRERAMADSMVLKQEAVAAKRSGVLATAVRPAVRWRLSDHGRLQRSFDQGKTWGNAPLPAGITLRALTTVGSAVWAGGSGGAIFHLRDGEEFVRQPLPSAGTVTPGDIVRIEFTDLRRGRATDSQGHVWATADGGQTWQLSQ